MDEKQNITNKDKTMIVGVSILRFYMAFMVVSSHMSERTLTPIGGLFNIFQGFHVPVFMLLSFLLCAKYFLEPTKELIVKRVLRIIIPFFFWGIVGYLFTLLIWDLNFEALIWQLTMGLPANTSLWYLAVTLWIAIIFWVIRLLTNKKVFIILISIIGVLSIVSQYTGLNYLIFNDLPYSPRISLGRIAEMIPYAVIGVLTSYLLPIIKRMHFKQHLIIFISIGLLLAGLLTFDRFLYNYRPQGFDYSGLFMIVVAFLLVITAFTNPLNFIENFTFKTVVKWVTSFTLGVFCIHLVLGRFVELMFISFSWEIKTTAIVFVTYALSYLLSLLIYLIPNKYTKMLVS